MVFSSTIFLFLFLPVVLALYFLSPKKARNLFLLIASLFFYSWGETWFVLVMLFSTVTDYLCGLAIAGGFTDRIGKPLEQLPEGSARSRPQKAALFASVLVNLSVLGIFKYFYFILGNYNSLAGAAGLAGMKWETTLQITLPLGISFYTFQSMSYTIDVYRGKVCATRNFLNFSCFVTLFPQLVAGPIVRYRDIAESLVKRAVGLEGFACGARRFIIGLGKKVLIANIAAVPADVIFALPQDQLTCGLAWLGAVSYTLQIYFDFSGYSDMAIGMGRMFGFTFPENFNFPYAADSIRDFWRRWHISLSRWFQDYLYIPLGGSRMSNARTYANLTTVFFLCGLWHGASWTFVVWGLYHGAFLVIERTGFGRVLARLPFPLRHAYTLLAVIVGWVLFRAESFPQAMAFLQAMAGFAQGTGTDYYVEMFLSNARLLAMAAGAIGSMPLIPALARWRERIAQERSGFFGIAREATFSLGGVVILALILLGSALQLSASTHNPFIYFRF
jgi:alginate O-acetyltransferase complex protein AlgI